MNSEFEKLIGETGAKVPGLGVIIFKDSKKNQGGVSFKNFLR